MCARVWGPWREDGRRVGRVQYMRVADKITFKHRCGTVQLCAVKPIEFVPLWLGVEHRGRAALFARDPQAKQAVSAMGVWTPREGSLYLLHSNTQT